MPRRSKRDINKEIEEELKDNFSFLISSLYSPNDIQHFFETFLTDEEKTMLTKRLMLHLMISNNFSVDEISSVLGMSRESVYKHSLIWKLGDEIYKSIINKISGRRKTKEFWKTVGKILQPFKLAMAARTDMKARWKLASGDFS